MMHRISIVLSVTVVLVVAVVTVDAASPVVSNVTANQRDETTGAGAIVDITYDMEDMDSDSVDINIEVSNDGGETFTVPAVTFTGDVGRVEVGVGKAVEWQAGVDVPGEYWENCQAKVIAEDIPSGAVGEIAVDLPGGATMEMVWIEPGTFTMGSPEWVRKEWGYGGEYPQHEITITRGFYLGKYELTQGQWEGVMGTRPWKGQQNIQDYASYPAVYLSWEDVQAFIDTIATNELGGFRLPTEAEWEYACRAGTTTPWWFGDDESELGRYAWYFSNSGHRVHEIGTKLPNPWGLHDIYGNVSEWVQDWHDSDYYRNSPSVDPQGPRSGSTRAIRGGFWNGFPQELRSAIRFSDWPDDPDEGTGARLLRQGPQEARDESLPSSVFALNTREIEPGVVAAVDNIPPAPVTNLKAEDTPDDQGGSITLTWTASADDRIVATYIFVGYPFAIPGVVNYNIYRRTENTEYTLLASVESGVAVYADEAVVDGVGYTYTVRAADRDNETPGPLASAIAWDNVPRNVRGEEIRGLFGDDATVGMDDFLLFAARYEETSDDLGFEERYDLDGDGVVGLSDFLVFVANFGKVAVNY